MTFIAAPIWNEISRTQDLETEAGAIAFNLDQDQLAKMEDEWMKLEKEAGTPDRVASRLPTCLPLLAEGPAIWAYVDQRPELRNALPEILDAREAAIIMQAEWRLSDEEANLLENVLTSREALERWRKAAEMVEAMQHKTPAPSQSDPGNRD